MKKFYYLKKDDGSLVEIPERDLYETSKRHPNWKIVDETVKEDRIVIPDVPKQSALICPICGNPFKSESGLKRHKASHG